MKRLFYVVPVYLILLMALSTSSLYAAELSKEDATKLLAHMGYKNIVIVSVINGIGVMGNHIFSCDRAALAIGYAEKEYPEEIAERFLYDKDLGWFYYEVDKKNRRVRLWTVQGYRVIRPEPEDVANK